MRRVYSIPSSALQSTGDWLSILSSCAGLGFDTILLSLSSQNIFDDRLAQGLVLTDAVALATERSLQVLVEAPVSFALAGTPEAARLGLSERANLARDPRISPAQRCRLAVPFSDDAIARPWLEALHSRLVALGGIGVAGFCFQPSPEVPHWAWGVLSGLNAESGRAKRPAIPLWANLTRLADASHFESAGFVGAFVPVASVFDPGQFMSLGRAARAFHQVILSLDWPPRRSDGEDWDEDSAVRRSKLRLWLSAALGDGIATPLGFEYGLELQPKWKRRFAKSWAELSSYRSFDLSDDVLAANAFIADQNKQFAEAAVAPIWPRSAKVVAALRRSNNGAHVRLVLANSAIDHEVSVPAASVSREIGEFLPLRDALHVGPDLMPDDTITLRPAEVRILGGRRLATIQLSSSEPSPDPVSAVAAPRLVIEAVSPCVDSGRYPVKRIVGEAVHIEADAYGDGHDPIAVALLWRPGDETSWREKRMTAIGNDRWAAEFSLDRVGRYFFTIEAWRDEFAIYQSELLKKSNAGLPIVVELEEGRRILLNAVEGPMGEAAARLRNIISSFDEADNSRRLALLLSSETAAAFAAVDRRPFKLRLEPPIAIDAERKKAEFASWYELFPRSQSGDPNRHGGFDDVARRLPAIRDMGFDVVYFPPIHPIGKTNRKGRNNALIAGPDDPGSPYAIGSDEGGHKAIHPALGTLGDFRRLVAAAERLGIEIALDFAIQASPDHPWLKQRPEWFTWRPDGSLRYAENPPKKYEDIVNVDFYAEGATPSLWIELRDTLLFWIDQGVKLFRVDNPHTKPFPFWDWVINDIRRGNPDVIFLSEAFTRPKVMYRLAKGGFSQSYTYFTWRNTKAELTAYLTELVSDPVKQFFRPHFFVNTPDINPDFLQNAPRPAFLIRAALAATLSGLWGMYNGFELCEGRPDAQKKEYADSEKYEIRAWDWSRPGNIIAEIAALNRIRRENPCLHSHLGLTFLNAWNDNILFFEKATIGRENVCAIAVNLDPYAAHEADIEIPLWKFGLPDHGNLQVEDLVRGSRFTWTGKYQRVRLDPRESPYSIWRLS